ncbi:CbiQ family ECF transporter T component [Dermacoccaceae bacterium W4C1]
MIGFYAPGDSLLHRARPGAKLVLALALVTVAGLWPNWFLLAAITGSLLLTHAATGLPWRPLWRSARVLVVFVVLLALVQWWWSGWERSVAIVGQLVIAVLIGHLLMATTRISDMVHTISAVAIPLRRFGVRRDRVELVLGLAIGCIPRLASMFTQAREAAAARGGRTRVTVLVPAVVVSAVREADEIAEALAARGL